MKSQTKIIVYGSYSSWNGMDIISKEEYEAKMRAKVLEYVGSEREFEDWLCDKYNANEIWKMNDEEREAVVAQYAEKCKMWAEDDLEEEWSPFEIDTEIEVECQCVAKEKND